jgi:hypothetical protein
MSAKMNQAGKGSGKRRRFAGKMGVRVKTKGGYSVSPRSHTHGGHSSAWAGYTCGDTVLTNPKQQQTSSAAQGPYKVPAPSKKEHRHGRFGSISISA